MSWACGDPLLELKQRSNSLASSLVSLEGTLDLMSSSLDVQKLPNSIVSLLSSWVSHLSDFVSAKFNDWVFEWDSLMFS